VDLLIGLVIVAICVGILNGAVYGWLFFGVVLMLTGISDYFNGGSDE